MYPRQPREALAETIRNELTRPTAVALAPASNARFSAESERGTLPEVESLRAETEVVGRALDREAAFLEDASGTVEWIAGWIATLRETHCSSSASTRSSAATRRWRPTAGSVRHSQATGRCSFRGTTSRTVETGFRHRSLVRYLYADYRLTSPSWRPPFASTARGRSVSGPSVTT